MPDQYNCDAPGGAPAAVPSELPEGTYLGFDFGLKRIGLAAGNNITLTVTPIETVNNHNGTPDWQRIDAIMRQWKPAAMVVGRPLQMDGSVQDITHHAMGFHRRLQKRYQLPVFSADERRSSIDAAEIIKSNRQSGARGRTQRGDLDKIAAAGILQRWLESQFNR